MAPTESDAPAAGACVPLTRHTLPCSGLAGRACNWLCCSRCLCTEQPAPLHRRASLGTSPASSRAAVQAAPAVRTCAPARAAGAGAPPAAGLDGGAGGQSCGWQPPHLCGPPHLGRPAQGAAQCCHAHRRWQAVPGHGRRAEQLLWPACAWSCASALGCCGLGCPVKLLLLHCEHAQAVLVRRATR